jgi:hypothetical protein
VSSRGIRGEKGRKKNECIIYNNTHIWMKVMGRSSASLSSLHILTATQPKEKKNVCGALVWTGARVREELPGASPKK